MINSVQTIDKRKEYAFGDFTKKELPNHYWLNTKEDEVKITKPKSNLVLLNPDEAKKTNNLKTWGLSIAGATVLTAVGIFFVLKGGPRGLSKNFQKFRNYLENKVQSSKLENKFHTDMNRTNIFLIKKLDLILQKFDAINNFTSFKDLLFKNIMNNRLTGKYTGAIHSKITKIFEKIGRQSVVNAYKKTASRFVQTKDLALSMGSRIGKSTEVVEINGVRKTRAQWAEYLKQKNLELVGEYENGFNTTKLNGRYLKIKKTVKNLENKFNRLRIFWTKDLINSFMADSAIASEKLAIQNSVKNIRNKISYSTTDLIKDTEEKIMNLAKSVNFKDTDKVNILARLRRDIKKLGKFSETTLQVRNSDGSMVTKEGLHNKILTGMDDFRAEILKSMRNKSLDEKLGQEMLDNLSELRISFIGFKQGKIEEMLDIYKKLLSPEDYKILEKAYKSNIKKLDNSVAIETEDFINKARDLVLGSAPTDIVTILGSLATLGYYLGKSDNNEERASVSLKYGIPAIAGIGTSLYCNAKLYAGSKSLLIGSISTLIVNKIGVWADKKLKQYQAAKRAHNVQTNTTSTLDLTKS